MATTTQYWYDGTDLVYEEDDDGGHREYYHGPEGLLSMYDSAGGGSRRYHFFDGMGSTSELTDETGTELGTYEYDAFGVPIGTPPSVYNPFRYIGKYGYYYDAADDMYLLQQRYYRASIARFWTRDPIGDLDDIDLYRYVRNGPTRATDPSGLASFQPPPFLEKYEDAISKATGECAAWDPKTIGDLLYCIMAVENEGTKSFTWPLKENGSRPIGPCQIAPGEDKKRICKGLDWKGNRFDHVKCCARILCRCIPKDGNVVKGCGTYVEDKGKRRGQFQSISEDRKCYKGKFKECLVGRGVPNPSQTVPPAAKNKK
jgi:RHS repeat-associated protein